MTFTNARLGLRSSVRAEVYAGAGSAAAVARRTFWRGVFSLAGGFTATGELLDGGCVVVANHSSHADAPAIVAALPAGRRPAVAAAADYWFAGGLRSRVCRALVGGFAVRRSGGGSADLAGAVDLLRAGRAVVVFPEGTRSRTGEIGEFRSGALRLAADAGVPVVPVGIAGTRGLLPVHGRIRPHAVDVRIGRPLTDPTADELRAAVAELAAAPAAAADSALRQRVAAFAGSRWALALVAAWALAEAFFWPLLPEVALGVLAVAAPRRAPKLAVTAAAMSLVGCVLAYLLYAAGGTVPQPLTTSRMEHVVAADTRAQGPAAVRHQPFSGIPVKVYAAEAGRERVGVASFAVHVAAGRGLRILGTGLLLGLAGAALARWRRFYPAYLVSAGAGFAVGLSTVVSSWS
jgi:1-acyl-sn-glycerol-3-phosphate acyltransferase